MLIARSLLTKLNFKFNEMEEYILNEPVLRTDYIDDFNDSYRYYIQALEKVLKSNLRVPEIKNQDMCIKYIWNNRVDYIDFTGLPTNNVSVEEILESIFPESDGTYEWVPVPTDKIVLNAVFMIYHTM